MFIAPSQTESAFEPRNLALDFEQSVFVVILRVAAVYQRANCNEHNRIFCSNALVLLFWLIPLLILRCLVCRSLAAISHWQSFCAVEELEFDFVFFRCRDSVGLDVASESHWQPRAVPGPVLLPVHLCSLPSDTQQQHSAQFPTESNTSNLR